MTLTAPPTIGDAPVPDADADKINATWTDVRNEQDMSSRTAKPKSRLPCGIPSDTGRSSLSDQPSLVDVGESVGTPDSTLTSRTGITPRNAKFADLVLLPRGIRVKDTNAIVPSAFAHFKTTRPPEGYDKVEGLSHTGIWVSGGDEWVRSLSNEYKEMKVLGLCEEEFASLAKEQFLRRSPRYLPDSDDRQWRGERMLQLVSPPKENTHWRKPPVLDTAKPGVDWSWDIRPDCAYWLSLKGFNPRYRFQIQNCAYVRDWMTCPYFTVEFKRDSVSEDAAIAQVAAAGSMALYNRYKLREAACEARPELAQDSHIRHYALTFVGSKFVFWVLEPQGDERWHGCTMTRLVGADCTDTYGVEELVDWINEIHRWGMAAHGPSCERDIKTVLKLGGVRTSDIHAVLG
ncbi:hypothetical protein S40288_11089 [Stachybotrys chartarum IBT 40288]|nr:hypothetical protein S40288_11089 [Stachybotrys chartarum IBT 40288]